MRIRVFLMALQFGLVFSAGAQDTTNRLIKVAAQKVCDCMGKKTTTNANMSQLQQFATECVTTSAMDEFMAVAEARHLDLSDQSAMRKIGVEMGVELVKMKCQAFLDLARQAGSDSKSELKAEDVPPGVERLDDTKIAIMDLTTGTVLRTEGHDLLTIVVKGENGKEQKLVLMGKVTGSEKIAGHLATIKGKKFEFGWIESEVLDPVTGKFKKVKQIQSIK